MIITIPKPFSEILENLKPYKNIYIIGCAACATKCQTGGEEQVKKAAAELVKNGKQITGYAVLDTPCDMRIVKKDLARNKDAVSSDAILVLACGAGIQSVASIIEVPIYPGLNPEFLGTIERIGIYNEYCNICGDCIVDRTGGICPVARCAKGMINGPCGGAVDGKCEVDLQKDCVWILIYNKLKKLGKEKNILKEYMPPRKHSKPYRIDKHE